MAQTLVLMAVMFFIGWEIDYSLHSILTEVRKIKVLVQQSR